MRGTTILCGSTEKVTAPEALDEKAQRAERDRLRYHNPDGRYRSTVGIQDDEGNTFCVGCWWCEGEPTEADGWGL